MKIIHNVYDELVSVVNVFAAWRDFQSGKSRRREVVEYRFALEDNLFELQAELAEGRYRHGAYERFIVNDPKQRIIHKARVKDRIVHTLVARELERIYQPAFCVDSFACQQEKGISAALVRAVRFARQASINYTRNTYCLKCDVRKFFDNIDHEMLIEILSRKIKDEKFMRLVKEIVSSFSTKQGKGLPLGNFTSQWLANIYLNELDYFAKHELRSRFYLRYADDILIMSQDEGALLVSLARIERFLADELRLALHPDKVFIRKLGQGIDWVGCRILPHYVLLKKQTRLRMFAKLKSRRNEFEGGGIGLWRYYETLNSYLGLIKHCRGHQLADKIILQQYGTD